MGGPGARCVPHPIGGSSERDTFHFHTGSPTQGLGLRGGGGGAEEEPWPQPPCALHPRSHLAPVSSSRRQQPRLAQVGMAWWQRAGWGESRGCSHWGWGTVPCPQQRCRVSLGGSLLLLLTDGSQPLLALSCGSELAADGDSGCRWGLSPLSP